LARKMKWFGDLTYLFLFSGNSLLKCPLFNVLKKTCRMYFIKFSSCLKL
jgi:hypothetical protein